MFLLIFHVWIPDSQCTFCVHLWPLWWNPTERDFGVCIFIHKQHVLTRRPQTLWTRTRCCFASLPIRSKSLINTWQLCAFPWGLINENFKADYILQSWCSDASSLCERKSLRFSTRNSRSRDASVWPVLAALRGYFIPSQPDGSNLIYSAAELDFPPLKSVPALSEDPRCCFTAVTAFMLSHAWASLEELYENLSCLRCRCGNDISRNRSMTDVALLQGYYR